MELLWFLVVRLHRSSIGTSGGGDMTRLHQSERKLGSGVFADVAGENGTFAAEVCLRCQTAAGN